MEENEENVAPREANWRRTVGLEGVTQVREGSSHFFMSLSSHSVY